MSLENVAVLDAGSFTLKAGLTADPAGNDEPSVVIPSAVRDTRIESYSGGGTQTNGTIDAVKDRAISDWDAYEAILDEILYSKLGWKIGDEGALLAAEALFASRDEREKLTQLVFEHNNTAGFFLCSQPVLSLYALGKLSGTVVDVGHTITDICTVFEGQVLTPTTRRLDFGMQTVSQRLRKVLQGGSGLKLNEHALKMLSQAIIRVPGSSEEARALLQKGEAAPSESHTLPDGQEIKIRTEGLQLGEALVDGSTIGLDVPPTATALHSASTSVADVATRKAVLECLAVCGGGSAVSGLSQRLLRELRLLLAPSTAVALAQTPEYVQPHMQQYAAWMGGAITSKIVFTQNQHVSKADYDEHGPAVVHLKCCLA